MRTLFYFRTDESGARVRYQLVLDDTMLMVSDGPVMEDKFIKHPNNAALAAQLDELRRRGVQFTIENGAIRVLSVPDREQIIMSFFSLGSPCPFPGCEPLREEYKQALAELKANDDCNDDCSKGKLVRAFRDRAEILYASSLSNSGAGGQVS